MLTVYGFDGAPFDQNSIEAFGPRFLRSYVRIVPSGNYATGGDTLDLTNAGGSPASPSVVPVAQARGLACIDIRPVSKLTTSFRAADGEYIVLAPLGVFPVPFANLNALKLKLMLDIATEYVAGAYGADALGDIIQAELVWAR